MAGGRRNEAISLLFRLPGGVGGTTASYKPSNRVSHLSRDREPLRAEPDLPQPGPALLSPYPSPLPGRLSLSWAKLAGAAAITHLHLNRHPRGPAAAEIEQWPA